MMGARGRPVRERLEGLAGPFRFERLVTVTIAIAGLITAGVSYLAVNSNANLGSAARNTERYAILTASQNVQGQARYNYDYYGAFRLWEDLSYRGLLADASGDSEKAERLREARDAIQDQSGLLQPPYNSSMEEVPRFPGYFLGAPELAAFQADLYVGPAAETLERYSIASRQRDAWSAEGTEYVRTLAFLGVALLLLGLATPLPRNFRWVFYGLGVVVAVGGAYNAAGVYFRHIPTVSEAAIQAYGVAAGKYEKSQDDPSQVDAAIGDWTRAIAAQHDYGHAYLARADALSRRASNALAKDAPAARKDYEAAIADYDAAAGNSQDEQSVAQEAYASKGRILYSLGRLDDAVKANRKAMDLSPNQASVRFELVQALLASGDLDGAQREFDHGIEISYAAVEQAWQSGGFASPIVFFDLDRAAIGLRNISDRISQGDRGSSTAPPLNSMPSQKLDGIQDKANDLYALARSEAVAFDRKPPEQLGPKPDARVTSVQTGIRRSDGTIETRKTAAPLSKELTLSVAYTGAQPEQRLALRIYYYGSLEENQLRREVPVTASNGTVDFDISYPGKIKTIAPGNYRVEVHLDNYLIGTGSFTVDTNLGAP